MLFLFIFLFFGHVVFNSCLRSSKLQSLLIPLLLVNLGLQTSLLISFRLTLLSLCNTGFADKPTIILWSCLDFLDVDPRSNFEGDLRWPINNGVGGDWSSSPSYPSLMSLLDVVLGMVWQPRQIRFMFHGRQRWKVLEGWDENREEGREEMDVLMSHVCMV